MNRLNDTIVQLDEGDDCLAYGFVNSGTHLSGRDKRMSKWVTTLWLTALGPRRWVHNEREVTDNKVL